jgi:osmotically inducible protein OsmC
MQTIAKTLYETTVSSTGGREGSVRSADGELDLLVHAPKELGGPGGATNPEQLFAAGYAACFHSALVLVASTQGVETSGSEVTATVRLGKDEQGGYGLAVDLTATLPGVDADTTERLLQRAHRTCPYSLATQGNIEVSLRAG